MLFWGKLTRLPNTDGSLGMAGMMREMDAKNVTKKEKGYFFGNTLFKLCDIVFLGKEGKLTRLPSKDNFIGAGRKDN